MHLRHHTLPIDLKVYEQLSFNASMVKQVYTADLKSAARKGVPVRFRLEAPSFTRSIVAIEKYH
jgi:hypothetical protein